MIQLDNNVQKILDDFGARVTKLAKINVGASRTVDGKRRKTDSSGKLRNSISYNAKVSKTNKSFEFSISMQEYGVFVDGGRDGTEKKRASNKSLFYSSTRTGKGIPLKPLLAWIKKKPIRVRDLSTGSFVKATESRIKSLAFLINRKIREEGIAATNFLSDPFGKEFKGLPEKIIKGFGLDVEEFFKFSTKE